MLLQTNIERIKYSSKIDYTSKILMIGSCFVSNINEKLQYRKFNTLCNPLGTIYNPQSVVDTLTILHKKRLLKLDDLFEQNGVYGAFAANTLFNGSDNLSVQSSINSAIENGHNFIIDSNTIIITLGTAHCYYLKENNRAVANCHKFKASLFEKRLLNHTEIEGMFSTLFEQDFFKSKRIIFTISPVRYSKDGFTQNSISKSHLLIAVNELTTKYSNVDYFPAYEIFNDELRDYRFYADDMIHPSPLGVEYVWQLFHDQLISDDAQKVIKKVENIQRRLNHRPFNPESAEHKRFVEQTKTEIEQINTLIVPSAFIID